MSYTPNEQQLKARLQNLRGALDETLGAIEARIDDRESWTTGHILEMQHWHKDLSEMRQRISVFYQEVGS